MTIEIECKSESDGVSFPKLLYYLKVVDTTTKNVSITINRVRIYMFLKFTNDVNYSLRKRGKVSRPISLHKIRLVKNEVMLYPFI